MSFVFYDTETTGTHLAFDQILQFAAIRTDNNLNEIERLEMRCHLLPHVIPSAGAMCVTGVGIEQLLDPALPSHYEMICDIAGKLRSWSPAIFAGWNTMRFDESLLRQALFQNLHPPFLTNSHGNGRTDIMLLAQALSALRPGTLYVPLGDRGKPTFKLDRLAPANGFAHENAHDALADVEATIHICRLIRDRAPEEWRSAISNSSKAGVIEFTCREPAFVLTESYFNHPHQFALVRIGHKSGNPGTIFALDLRADIGALSELNHCDLVERLSRSPKIVRTIRANAAPVLTPLHDEAGFAGISASELRCRAVRVQADTELCRRLAAAVSVRTERPPPEYVEEQIYSAFTGRADEYRMRKFHQVRWPERLEIVEQFEDERLVELGRRLIFLHDADLLDRRNRLIKQRWLTRRRHGDSSGLAPWTTAACALAAADSLLVDAYGDDRAILKRLRAYLQAMLPN